MTEGTTSRVECLVCGEEFDPSAAGGWCTNSECGQWRYAEAEGSPPDTADESADPLAAEVQSGDESSEQSTDEEPSPAITKKGAPSAAEGGGEAATSTEAATEGEATVDCPSCGADVGEDVNFCPICGTDMTADGDGASDADSGDAPGAEPNSLVLVARGQEIVVKAGDAVGRELRRIITESGGDQEDAVRIHREHIRFEREDGQFFLVNLGQNPTRLNNIDMEQGDRKPVEPGDEIELSGVVTLSVEAP